MNTRADRVSRVADSDRQRSPDDFGCCFPHSRDMRWRSEPPVKKRLAPKRKCKYNEDWKRDLAKLQDCGMAQCNLRATDFSISSGGRTEVRRHQESVRHARLAKSKGSTKGGMVQYVAPGQNEVDGVTNMLYIYMI